MIGVVLIAAGESRRLGTPKQLLPWAGHTLLRHAATTALSADLGPVVVVLGAHEPACRAALGDLPVEIIYHQDWSAGMGGSIAAGVRALHDRALEAMIVMLCDQPFVSAATLRKLVVEWRRGSCEVLASRAGEIAGPPALFSSKRFDRLLELNGHQGAKSLICQEPSLGFIEFPEAAIDVDTQQDWSAIEAMDLPVRPFSPRPCHSPKR